MPKTVFSDPTPANPVGAIVWAAQANGWQNHRHDGLNQDGSAPVDFAEDTGAANAYAIAPAPALTQYIPGMPITFLAANTNTGASTLNINGLGMIAIKRAADGADLFAGDIRSGQLIVVIYDGAHFQLLHAPNEHPGDIKMTGAAAAPPGWLLCDGSALSRATYAALFAIIGVTFGAGDGATTFNVPDSRGRAPIGAGQGAGLTNRALGAETGEENHLLAISEMPAHNHGVTDPGHWHDIYADNGWPFGTDGQSQMGSNTTDYDQPYGRSSTNPTGIAIQNAGGGGGHNNMQPSVAVNFIIKY